MTTLLNRFCRLCGAILTLLIASNIATAHTAAFSPQFVPAAETIEAGWDDRFGAPGVYNGSVVAATVSEAGDLYVAGSF